MSIEIWIGFVIASSVLLIIPGPTILTVISYSISHGYKARIPLILAVALGDSTALALSFYTVFAGKAQRLLASQKTQKMFNFSGGTMLSVAGLWALSAKHS